MKITATSCLVVFSFCSIFSNRFLPLIGLKERSREKKMMTELAPKANEAGSKGLKGELIAMGMNIPKNIAAL